MYSDKCFRSHFTPHSKDRRAKRLRQGRADDLAAGEGSYLQPSTLPPLATVRWMDLLPACCAAAVSPAFPGSAARRRSLGSPADAVPWAHRPTPWKAGMWEDSTLLRLRRPTSLTSIEAARFLQPLADGDLPAARPRATTV
ncbi:hypothetical protein VPH35_018895 [Triticum aestivum]